MSQHIVWLHGVKGYFISEIISCHELKHMKPVGFFAGDSQFSSLLRRGFLDNIFWFLFKSLSNKSWASVNGKNSFIQFIYGFTI